MATVFFKGRALTAHAAETDAVQFFVGTQSLRCENQVHRVDFDDENNVISKYMFLHNAGEVWSIASSPLEQNVISTIYNSVTDTKAEMLAAIWRVPTDSLSAAGEESISNAPPLQLMTSVDSSSFGEVRSFIWHPSGERSTFIVLADSHIVMYDLESSGTSAKVTSSSLLEGKSQPKFSAGKWNPHHNCVQIATANDSFIRGWDVRSLQQVYCIENAHSQLVRDLDFNPNKQYYLASCGDDCRTKFWDIRNTTEPVKVLSDHSHWVWSVRYNHFHDQLVLTSSSDSRVILNNVASISSEPYGHLVEDDENEDENGTKTKSQEPMADGVIAVCEEHEDSVYAAEWSCADPWIFASLSYDGRLVINRVPRATKYRILL